ncbi:hypothetical protein CHCC20335_1397 [Bacillus paralicheniformis]|nr:hypothetical protein CHCC20335_1397 [Bacillus paralicheniformis]
MRENAGKSRSSNERFIKPQQIRAVNLQNYSVFPVFKISLLI